MPSCNFCQRTYQRKIYFDRHVIACEFLSKSNRERNLELEELSDTPSVRDLYKIIMELAAKCNNLESQMNNIIKATNIKKQKLNITDWLHQHKSSDTERISFNQLLKNIKITRDDLNILFETDYVNGAVKVLNKYLTNKDTFPICAFNNKDNKMYIYCENDSVNNDNTDVVEWRMCNNDDYKKLMFLIDKQFLSEFVKWQDENKHKGSNDDFALIYSKNMKKVMGGERDTLYSRIKKELYNLIEIDLPNILEYEISY